MRRGETSGAGEGAKTFVERMIGGVFAMTRSDGPVASVGDGAGGRVANIARSTAPAISRMRSAAVMVVFRWNFN